MVEVSPGILYSVWACGAICGAVTLHALTAIKGK